MKRIILAVIATVLLAGTAMSQDYKLMKHHIGGAFGFVKQDGQGDLQMSALAGQTVVSYNVMGATDVMPTYTHGFWGPFIDWYSSVEENDPFAATDPLKVGNYPNPFRDQTTISFTLKEASYVSLRIYDLNGSLVARLRGDEILGSGTHEETWDGKDLRNKDLSSGSYLYELIASPSGGGKAISVRNIMVMNR